jgi:hypothetical protein
MPTGDDNADEDNELEPVNGNDLATQPKKVSDSSDTKKTRK